MAEVLSSLSKDLAAIVEGTAPSVVRVEGRRRLPASGIVWSSDGVVVTAHHVVERDENLSVGLHEIGAVPAKLIGRDPSTDLAVLRVDARDLTPPVWAEVESVRVGHLVLALGRPRKTVQATLGIVSALGDDWRTPVGGRVHRFLQTDVVMYPGFSGGPLVSAGGQVMGLNTSALLRGISLSLPTPTVESVVDTLLTHGRVRRGFLGVGAQPVKLPEKVANELDQETGLLLVSVEAGSPAEKGGLAMGDTIVHFAGEPTGHLEALLTLLSGDRIGQSVPVRIVRGGEVQDLTVEVGERK